MAEEKQRVINGRNLENSNNAMKENETWLLHIVGITLTPSLQGMEDTVWRVGCYNINPTTPNGQKFFILHMLVLPLIPITALVIQNSVTWDYEKRVHTFTYCYLNPSVWTPCWATSPVSPPSGGRSGAPWRLPSSYRTCRRRGLRLRFLFSRSRPMLTF